MKDDLVKQSAELSRQIRQEVRAEVEKATQEKLDSRTLPPMAQMSRIQKRYFLEPWMTAATVVSWVVAVTGFILGMFTARHVEFCMLGLMFVLLGAATLITKLNFMEWNSKTEGQIRARDENDYYR